MKLRYVEWLGMILVSGLSYGEILVNETFDDQLGRVPKCQRASQTKVVEGREAIGTDPAARFYDESEAESGVFEYTVGEAPVGAFLISFDLLNNSPADSSDKREAIIFSGGQWAKGKDFILKSSDARAFAMDFAQGGESQTMSLRVGKNAVKKASYDKQALQQVKIWVNDNDSKELSYTRPDTKEAAQLSPDSFVVWVNDELVAGQSDKGIAMQTSISAGDAVLGRIGFSSLKADRVDFLVDNFRAESISP